MTDLSDANNFIRNKLYKEALPSIEKAWQICIDKNYPESIASYCALQVHYVYKKQRQHFNSNPNIVITACNSKYFPSLLLLIDSILLVKAELELHIFVFDLGLSNSERAFLEGISNISLFTWEADKVSRYESACQFNILDNSTYFFKVYGFHEGVRIAQRHFQAAEINALWVDAGNMFQFSPVEIFDIIESSRYFFIDHADVAYYYPNATNNIASTLSPAMFESALELPHLSAEQMLLPYVKANLFGIHICHETEQMMEMHLNICCKTLALCDPRMITDKHLSEFWKRHYNIDSDLYLYRFGRHEQSVWSYLVAMAKVPIFDTRKFSFTVSAGSSTLPANKYKSLIHRIIKRNPSSFEPFMRNYLKSCDPRYSEISASPLGAQELLDNYISVSQKLFLDEKRYTGIGFPHPLESKGSIVKLHRGALAAIDQYKFSGQLLNHAENIRDDIFILLGNGPSLAEVNLKDLQSYHTFGLNAAYRAYSKINFWPTYFGCFDALVCSHHSSSFKDLIMDSPINKFFFIDIDDKGDKIFTERHVNESQRFQRLNFNYRTPAEKARTDILSLTFDNFIDMRTSGSNSIQAGLLMGYRKFILLGVDQNYVEVVSGAKKDKSYHKLIMEETPDHNPNYWFSDYQQKGDKFNRPNLEKSQIPAWNNLSMTLQALGIKCMIYNCSPISRLESFEKLDLSNAIANLERVNVNQIQGFQSPRQFTNFV
jgi:hypothetical protein